MKLNPEDQKKSDCCQVLLVFTLHFIHIIRNMTTCLQKHLTSCQPAYSPFTPVAPQTHLQRSSSSRRHGNAWMTWAMRLATANELAAMTLLDIMSNSEPEETYRPMRGGHAPCRYTQVSYAITCQIQTIRIHDDASSLLDNDGRGSNVPAVHPDVIVGIGSTCCHLTHVDRRRPQRTDTGAYKQHINKVICTDVFVSTDCFLVCHNNRNKDFILQMNQIYHSHITHTEPSVHTRFYQ